MKLSYFFLIKIEFIYVQIIHSFVRRKITEKMASWKDDSQRKAILIRGCRQIGKTYIIRDFISSNYECYMEFNLEERKDIAQLFRDKNLTAPAIIDRLIFDSPDIKKIVPGNSAIFLDEIQSCTEAYASLKALADDGRFDIFASGSLLGVMLNDLQDQSPLGYVNMIDMYPMDFEEFLWAMGIDPEYTEYIRKCILRCERIDEFILTRISDLFRRYLVVGGMPAAVIDYASKQDYSSVRSILGDIAELIRQDAQRYSKGAQRMHIDACLKSIPEQLAKPNKKFQYTRIEKRKGVGKRIYGPALMWLKNAGLIHICNNVTEPVSPLRERTVADVFKIYLADTGILMALTEENIEGTIVNRDPLANNGMVMENAVACALRSKGYTLRYYEKTNSTLEIEFVINLQGSITAMEVKSGKKKKSKSLKMVFTTTHTVGRAIKLSEGNVFKDENGVEHYPLFGVCFFPDASYSDLGPIDYMDDLKGRLRMIGGKDAPDESRPGPANGDA